jgi:hypothetical protein
MTSASSQHEFCRTGCFENNKFEHNLFLVLYETAYLGRMVKHSVLWGMLSTIYIHISQPDELAELNSLRTLPSAPSRPIRTLGLR